jgi:CTP:molybdopterin cytidylyltransferase MocA
MTSDFGVDAILPAGGRITGTFAAEAETEVKALISFSGQTVLERTLNTLYATGCVECTVVIGPDEVATHPAARAADVVLPEGDSGPENIFRGLEWLRRSNGGRHAEHVLIVTTDLPFLTPQAVTHFINTCPHEADVCVPVIHREAFQSRFPNTSNSYVRLRDGEWTIGCAFLVNPTTLMENHIHLERVFAARKSQWAMARLLGLTFILRFLSKRLTVNHIEQRSQEILRCRGVGVHNCAPELAFDIDQREEYHYARQHI